MLLILNGTTFLRKSTNSLTPPPPTHTHTLGIPPSFTHSQTLVDQLVLEGSEVSFPCMAEGFPLPTFSWRRPSHDGTQPINIDQISK